MHYNGRAGMQVLGRERVVGLQLVSVWAESIAEDDCRLLLSRLKPNRAENRAVA
jgi:hypothetical protein